MTITSLQEQCMRMPVGEMEPTRMQSDPAGINPAARQGESDDLPQTERKVLASPDLGLRTGR